jgi:hypothetical protein
MQNLIYFLSLHSFRADTRLTDIFGAGTPNHVKLICLLLEAYGSSLVIIKSFTRT